MSFLDRARRLVDRAVATAAGGLMGLLLVNVLWQVATRFLLRRPSAFTEEIARYGLVWLGLLGATCAYRRGLHPSLVEALVTLSGRHGDRVRSGVARVAPLLVGAFGGAVMVYGGARLVVLSAQLGQRSAALGLPLFWVYLIVPLTGLLVVFYAACGLVLGDAGATDSHREDG